MSSPDLTSPTGAAAHDAWPAPLAARPVTATCVVPGSKSMTNRALVLAALADGTSRISAGLRARDTLLMAHALRSLGVDVRDVPVADQVDDWLVTPGRLRGDTTIDCGLAGTVMRFLPLVAALADGPVHFDGDPRARVRPMGAIVEALRALGVRVDDEGRGSLPFTVHAQGGLDGGEVELDASASSQFVSALLLAAPRMRHGLTVRHVGAPVPSLPHIDMTVQMLREHGVDVTADISDPTRAWWRVVPGAIRAHDRVIEPDLSNAAPFLAAAAVTGGRVTIPHWPASTTQAGAALPALLGAMGCTSTLTDAGLTLTGPTQLRGLDADLHDVGELTPVIAAVAALASTPSRLTGVAHLRGHETDRLAALATEINRLGGHATELEDGLAIDPVPMHGALVHSYEDHRMATAGAVIGLRVPGVYVEDIATTGKTLPDFTAMWDRMLSNGLTT